jgi:hypothetical protein
MFKVVFRVITLMHADVVHDSMHTCLVTSCRQQQQQQQQRHHQQQQQVDTMLLLRFYELT